MTFLILYFKASDDPTTQVLDYNATKPGKCLMEIIQLFW